MTLVVVDASAGVEMVSATPRGRAMLRLLPSDAELWVPEHFYVEVLGVLRHQSIVAHTLDSARADQADDHEVRERTGPAHAFFNSTTRPSLASTNLCGSMPNTSCHVPAAAHTSSY